jgi:hypothetical protein
MHVLGGSLHRSYLSWGLSCCKISVKIPTKEKFFPTGAGGCFCTGYWPLESAVASPENGTLSPVLLDCSGDLVIGNPTL